MKHNTKDFDCEAATWDDEPRRVKLVRDIADTISRAIELNPNMDVLDFGCGTGLLTLHLSPLVHSVTGVDSSQGMLDIFNAKIARLKLSKASATLVDLDKGDALTGRYDLVVSSMTLHHVKDIEALFAQFHRVTAPGGYLCIADLDLDDGQFHADNTGVFHFGFSRAALRKLFTEAGFDYVRDRDATEMVKPNSNGELRRFSIFLMIGQRSA